MDRASEWHPTGVSRRRRRRCCNLAKASCTGGPRRCPFRTSRRGDQASLSYRWSSLGEETALSPLPPDAIAGRVRVFGPLSQSPGGGPSRTGVIGTQLPTIANGTASHHHKTPDDSGVNTTYISRHRAVNQTIPPFPGSPAPQVHIYSSLTHSRRSCEAKTGGKWPLQN